MGACQWEASCPAHDDRQPSLAISLGRGDRVLLHCHAGCDTRTEVLPKLGLKWRDLWPHDERGKIISSGSRRGKVARKMSDAANRPRVRRARKRSFIYRDERGKPLLKIVRTGLADGGKKITQHGWDKKTGKWRKDAKGVRRVLFRLPTVLAAETPVYVVEGEKNAKDLIALGLTATCNPGGAGKWNDDYSKALIGKRVFVLPDNDDPGRKHARQIALSVHEHGAAEIRVLLLPDLPHKGDVSDWLAAGGDEKWLARLAERSPVVTDADIHNGLGRLLPPTEPPRFRLMTAEEIEHAPAPDWLIEEILPEQSFCVLYGESEMGKSFVALDFALAIQNGIQWKAGERETRKGQVIYVAAEGRGGLGSRIRAWRDRRGNQSAGELMFITEAVQLPAETDALLDTLQRLPLDPVLVILDTLARTLVGDENNASDIGAYVSVVDRIRSAFDCAVLVIHHTGKDGHKERGSSALRCGADVMMKLDGFTRAPRLTCDKAKDFGGFNPIHLSLDVIEFDDGDSSCVVVSRDPTGGERDHGSADAQRLLEFVREGTDHEQQTGVTPTAIDEHFGWQRKKTQRVLRPLVKSELVRRVGGGNKVLYTGAEKAE